MGRLHVCKVSESNHSSTSRTRIPKGTSIMAVVDVCLHVVSDEACEGTDAGKRSIHKLVAYSMNYIGGYLEIWSIQ